MIIRDAAPRDHAAIRGCVDLAFGQPAEGHLVEALRRAGDAAIELVAEETGEIIGHVLLSPLTAPRKSLGLAPLSVIPVRQKQGIGGALMQRVIDEARRRDWAAMFLLGEPGYYSRFGFSVESAAKFQTVYPKEYMMALALRPGALAGLDGEIIYAPAFRDLE